MYFKAGMCPFYGSSLQELDRETVHTWYDWYDYQLQNVLSLLAPVNAQSQQFPSDVEFMFHFIVVSMEP